MKKTQNYTVSFKDKNINQIGFIKKIYKIKNQIFVLMQKFEKINNFSLDAIVEAKLNEFFSISILTHNYAIISIENIQEKCIYLKNNNEYFISLIHDEEEHD
jgi:hypothetical protein